MWESGEPGDVWAPRPVCAFCEFSSVSTPTFEVPGPQSGSRSYVFDVLLNVGWQVIGFS